MQPETATSYVKEFFCELQLMALSLIILGFAGSLFTENLLQPSLIFMVVVIHLLWSLARKLNLSVLLAVLINSILSSALLAFIYYFGPQPRLANDVLLTGNFFTDLNADFTRSFENLGNETIPLSLTTGFLLIAALLVFGLSAISDWASFRLRASSSDGVWVYVIGFVAIMLFDRGTDTDLPIAIVFAVAALLFCLSHGTLINKRSLQIGNRAMLGTGAVMLVFVLGTSVVAGVGFRPAGEPAKIDLSSIPSLGSGSGGRVVLNPLVDIQSQLVTENNTKLFTVLTNEPRYWRMTSLDSFDGDAWSSEYTYSDISNNLRPSAAIEYDYSTRTSLTQTYIMNDFGTDWLPNAYEVQNVRDHTTEKEVNILYDPYSSSLLFETPGSTVEGVTYSVNSSIPSYRTSTLTLPAERYPDFFSDEFLRQNLWLPAEGIPQLVYDFALEATADAAGPYRKAVALQNWFRQNFTYDLEVERGHSIDRVEDFLELRRGYCEQFASTYAIMARSLGIPARVVVGFTWGVSEDPEDALADAPENINVNLASANYQQAYSVYGRHYHSWVEILLPGTGWVLMEPTPSRGAPNAPHTLVPPSQDDTLQPSDSDDDDSDDDLAGVDVTTTLPPTDFVDTEAGAAGSQTGLGDNIGFGTWAMVAALIAAAALLVLFPLRGRLYELKVRGDTSQRVLLAWRKSQLIWRRAGLARSSNMTMHEFAREVAHRTQLNQNPLDELADLASKASFSQDGMSPNEAAAAEHLSRRAVQQAVYHIPKWKRLLGFGIMSPMMPGVRLRH